MNSTGKVIAISTMWLVVGIATVVDPIVGIMLSMVVLFATIVVTQT